MEKGSKIEIENNYNGCSIYGGGGGVDDDDGDCGDGDYNDDDNNNSENYKQNCAKPD